MAKSYQTTYIGLQTCKKLLIKVLISRTVVQHNNNCVRIQKHKYHGPHGTDRLTFALHQK